MVFGEIFISLLVILILYYAVAISMELFMKPQVQDAASGNEETEIDITDEARNFQTIEVRRDTRPVKKNPSGENTADNKVIRPVMTNGIAVEVLVSQVQNISGTDDVELEGLGKIVAKCEKAA